jgi:hypothetical protein
VAIAFDAATSSGVFETTKEFEHTPAGTPRGVIVQITDTGPGGTDKITSVAYGGVTMERKKIQELTTGGEQGAVYEYFLGSGIPTGKQTVKITTSASIKRYATVVTLTASANTESLAVGGVSNDSLANPSFEIAAPASREAFIYGGLVSGHENPANVTPNGSYTQVLEVGELGSTNELINHIRRTSNSSGGTVTVSWTATAENTCAAGIAVGEVSSKTVEFKASISSTSAVTARLSLIRLFKATISSASALSAKLSLTRFLKASVSGTSAITAKLNLTRFFKASILSSSGISASLALIKLLTASISSASEVKAKLLSTRLFRAAISSVSAINAVLQDVHPSQFAPADLKAAKALDSLIREPTKELFGENWHGVWADTGIGTPAGWTHAAGDEFSTARWWRYGFPSPAFIGLTFAEPLSEGQELRLILGDNKLGNSVALKVFWNNAEEYFYSVCEEVGGEELEPPLASGFVPRSKGDRFYLSLEDGENGVQAWREAGGGEPEVFAQGTPTHSLEDYGATADMYLLHPGTFRGQDFVAVSLNPEPPIEPKATGKMRVVLNGGGWGGKEPADIAAAVHMVRFDTELGTTHLEELLGAGLLIHCLFAGPYDEGGVKALDPDEWVANALAFYEANLDPTTAPIVEVLNEPHGSWFWGEKANSAANALAYRTLVKKAYEAFHARYGDEAPKIIASVEPVDSWGERWWEPNVANYLDGVGVHPYGGNDPEEKATSAEGRRREVKEARQLTGDSLPVYCSEFGWPTAIGKEPTGDSLQWTEAEQAANITAFFNWARATRYVAECVYFCHHDFGVNTLYGVVDIEGNHKLGYAAIQEQTAIYDLPEPTRVAVAREFPPDRLAVRIADPTTDQTIARWAEDEGKAANVLAGLTKSGEMPGGHKDSSGSLPRDPRVNWPDTFTYLDYFIEGAGREVVWSGRLNLVPKSDGERMVLEPKAVGHQTALEDREALRMGFIDGDQSKWGDPSTARRLKLIEAAIFLVASTSQGFSSLDPSATVPGVINDFTNVENQEGRTEAGEADYSSGGVDLGAALYDYRQLTDYSKDTNWESNLAVGTTDTFDVATAGSDHDRTTALQQSVEAPGPGYRFARLRDRYGGGGSGPLGDVTAWQNLKVLSWLAAQNLTLQGTWPNVGYTAKQMLEVAVPEFSYLEVNPEDIEDDGFVIPQAWYPGPGMLADVVKDLTKYGLYYWFVMNGKRFELRQPGTFGREWQAYAGASEFKETGEDGLRLWDRLVVAYQDVSGRTVTIGYPGSGADYESEALQITAPDHPAVRAEVVREDLLTLKGISDFEPALGAGERWLVEGNELSHAGEAVLRGYIQDSAGIFRPVSQIQPGDRIRFPDAGSGGTGYREIVAVSYDHDPRTATVNLDAPPDTYEALLERYGATLSSLQLA